MIVLDYSKLKPPMPILEFKRARGAREFSYNVPLQIILRADFNKNVLEFKKLIKYMDLDYDVEINEKGIILRPRRPYTGDRS